MNGLSQPNRESRSPRPHVGAPRASRPHALRSIALIGVLAVVAALVPVTAAEGQEGSFDELSVGDWEGVASVFGTTTAQQSGATIDIFGVFDTWIEFVVPTQGLVEGPWDLVGATDWTLTAQGQDIQVSLDHAAQGELAGTRSSLTMSLSSISTTGSISVAGETIAIDNVDPFGPIELMVSGIWCKRAWGEWVLSWNTNLEGAGFTPTFFGDWWAIRIPEEDQSAEAFELLAKQFESIGTKVRDVLQFGGEIDGVPIAPDQTLIDLMREIAWLDNELANLSLCDRSHIGDAQVEEWRSTLASGVAALAATLLGNLELRGDTLSGSQLLTFATFLSGTSVLGPGTRVDLEERQAVRAGLQQQVDQILSDPNSSRDDLINAVVTADTYGLDRSDFDMSRLESL